jgi:hypothetical protein
MGTIAEKLTYLNTTKEKIRDSINLTGANIGTSDTFRSYATKLKQGYLDIINNGTDTLYNNFPKVSGIGSNLSLTPTYEAPMKLNEIQGDTLQDGTPTPDTPVEIQNVTGLQKINVCGKNLLPYPYFSGTTTNRGITFTPREDGSILVNGTATGQATFALYGNYLEENQKDLTGNYLSGGTNNVKLRAYNHTGSSYTDLGTDAGNGVQINKTTYTTGYIELVVANGTTINNVIIKPMMLNSLDDTSYEPYNGNTYEVNLGKNLSRIEDGTATINGLTMTIQNGVITLNGTTTASCVFKLSNGLDTISDTYPNTDWFNENVVNELGGKVLSINPLSGTAPSSSWAIRLFKSTTTHLYQYTPSNFAGDKVYTTGENISCICIFLNANRTFDNYKIQIQLEKGTQSTSFSPYFTPIELNKIGDYQDSIKKSTGKNLFDSTIIKGVVTNTNINTDTNTRICTQDFIKVKPNTTYTLSFTSNIINQINISYFTSNSFPRLRQTNWISNFTFTTANDENYILITYRKSDDSNVSPSDISNMQLEQNSQATTYEPYGKVWYIEKNINKKIFNGSNSDGTWAKQTGYYNCNANLGGITGQGYTNYYSYGNLNTENKFFITTNAFRVNDSTDTLENYITWLSTHNIELYYVSNTPTYDTITNEELIEQLDNLYTAKSQDGTTNISITSEDLEMILNVSALKSE